jgi:hypothetical protein
MNPRPKSLDDLLAELPRDIAPPRHVWNGILRGIVHRHRAAQVIAVAASVACALLATALVWAVLRSGPSAPLPALAARPNFADLSDAKYMATRTVLETTFRERLAQLDPSTRAQVEASLAVIRRAHEDIRRALAAEPANPLLEQLFESTWHDEFDLYDHIVHATQPTLART